MLLLGGVGCVIFSIGLYFMLRKWDKKEVNEVDLLSKVDNIGSYWSAILFFLLGVFFIGRYFTFW